MNNEIKSLSAKQYFAIIIVIILITDLAILLNIPLLRQIFGFLFLTLVPGLLILQILKLNRIGFIERFILSWGISIAFLMFFGILVNSLSLSLGYENPLSTIPLLISFNIAFIVLAVVGYKVNKEPFFHLPNLNLSTSEKAFLVVPILFPALSVFGMRLMSTTDNNIILMFLLILIPIYVVLVCLFNQRFPKRLYPVVVFLISISLVILLPLRSNHLIGDDVFLEYYFFQITLNNLNWSIIGNSILNTSLAISILPTIYQSLLDVKSEFLFKILYPVLCSAFPVIIYIISKKYIKEGYAFLASLYFLSNTTFLWTEYNARANIAMLFLAFAILTLFYDRIPPMEKRTLFIIFMAACVIAHYSTTYTFFFVILSAFIGIQALSKRHTAKKVISLTFVALFSVMMFFWYSQVTPTAADAGIYFIRDTFYSFNDFFIEEARSGPAQSLLGRELAQKSIIHDVYWLLKWITFAFIGIGIVTLVIRYKEMSFPELRVKKPDFLKEKFEIEYFVMTLSCAGLLVMILAIPYISAAYGLGRAYPLASTILSVFFVIGGIIIAKTLSLAMKALLKKSFLRKKNLTKRSYYQRNKEENSSQVMAYLIILLVLIPYFLCVTGAMYNIFGVQESVILNPEEEEFYILHDHEYCLGKWIKDNADQRYKIYSDGFMRSVLLTYTIESNKIKYTRGNKAGYICLGYRNIVNGNLNRDHMRVDPNVVVEKDRIYANGGSEGWI